MCFPIKKWNQDVLYPVKVFYPNIKAIKDTEDFIWDISQRKFNQMSNNKILRPHSVTNWCYKLQSLFTKCLRVFSLNVFSWFSNWIQTRTTAILKLSQISLASAVVFCRGFKKVHYSFVCERRRHDYEFHFPVTHFVFWNEISPLRHVPFITWLFRFSAFCFR